nr:unnamed protein product [Digitaria exilis]
MAATSATMRPRSPAQARNGFTCRQQSIPAARPAGGWGSRLALGEEAMADAAASAREPEEEAEERELRLCRWRRELRCCRLGLVFVAD